MSTPRIYLDNAATSYPKPKQVWDAVDRYQRELGTAIGRGSSRAGEEVQRIIDRCRTQISRHFGVSRPEYVLFANSGTDALNMAIFGLLNEGDRVIMTPWEHNSVLRPLAALARKKNVQTVSLRSDSAGGIELESLEEALQTPASLLIITHASNVTGVIQPVREVARMAQAAGVPVLLDAAQTAGHCPVNMADLGVDLIACPGHKGLMGPLGTGVLMLSEKIAPLLEPFRYGGTGTSSESPEQPLNLPDRFEAGNLNAPGLVGLAAAMDWHVDQKESAGGWAGMSAFIQDLTNIPGLICHLAESPLPRVDVVSLSVPRVAPQVMATLLDEHFGIECRAGLHCAPLAHRELKTLEQGGTVRLSPGPFTTEEEIDRTLEALAQIVVAM